MINVGWRYSQGFVKGGEFCYRYCDFHFSYKCSQPNIMEVVLLTKLQDKQSSSPFTSPNSSLMLLTAIRKTTSFNSPPIFAPLHKSYHCLISCCYWWSQVALHCIYLHPDDALSPDAARYRDVYLIKSYLIMNWLHRPSWHRVAILILMIIDDRQECGESRNIRLKN